MASVMRLFLAALAVVGAAAPAAGVLVQQEDTDCPIAQEGQDANDAPVSFVQTGASAQYPSKALKFSAEARQLSNVHRTTKSGFSIYNVAFKPAHFSCMKCDPGTCDKSNLVCDISACLGEFYETECWCRKDTTVMLQTPLWDLRKYDGAFLSDQSVHKFFCDKNCGGGVCDTDGLQCKRREEACKPWWWCGLNPPKEQSSLHPTDGWPDGGKAVGMSFLQVRQKQRSAQQVTARRKFEANDKSLFKFKDGRWVCEDAALPPKIQNAETYLWENRGYVVFPKKACKGGAFDKKCYCWDDVARLRGGDPKTSEATCDADCSFGGCEGRTCGSGPPPPLPPRPKAAPLDPIAAEEAKAGSLNNDPGSAEQV